MAKINPQVQAAFDAGFAGYNTYYPGYYSSTCWQAFQIGKLYRERGLTHDTIYASRGFKMRTGRGLIFNFKYLNDGVFYIERVQ